jgi:ABC-type dipeptide/oligopeptide/nickel transport system ATPase component
MTPLRASCVPSTRQLGATPRNETVRAVDNVMTIQRGEVVGLVGESGCGKSTSAAWSPASCRRRREKFCSKAGYRHDVGPAGPPN